MQEQALKHAMFSPRAVLRIGSFNKAGFLPYTAYGEES